MAKRKIKIFPLSKVASMIIKIGMPIITLVFLYILHQLITAPINEREWIYALAPEMIEYAVMSFTLVFCGAFIADTAEKYGK